MTAIVSWNIQAGRGVDGRVDLVRIARTVRALADADVICLQEVESRGSGGPGDDAASVREDQFETIQDLFPGYATAIGAGVERADNGAASMYRFGNMVLSRLPILSVFRHLLPQPAAPGVWHMPRQATEVTVRSSGRPLRVVTTHLEYHSPVHRRAQVERLRELHTEVAEQARHPGAAEDIGPYARIARPPSAVFCGDFNMESDSEEYAALLAPFDGSAPDLVDAWSALYPGRPHDPTCGVFDHGQWPAGAHCRDFFLVTEEFQPRLRSLRVDLRTDASDHQPIVLMLADGLGDADEQAGNHGRHGRTPSHIAARSGCGTLRLDLPLAGSGFR